MPQITNPVDELLSFQQALVKGEIKLQAGKIDPELYVYSDATGDSIRFTYVRLIGLIVTGYATMVMTEPMHGLPCFHASVAIPEAYRGKGYAKNVLQAAMTELKDGLSRNNAPSFYVEAVVGVSDTPSQRLAEAAISPTPVAVTDSQTGGPALQYIRKF